MFYWPNKKNGVQASSAIWSQLNLSYPPNHHASENIWNFIDYGMLHSQIARSQSPKFAFGTVLQKDVFVGGDEKSHKYAPLNIKPCTVYILECKLASFAGFSIISLTALASHAELLAVKATLPSAQPIHHRRMEFIWHSMLCKIWHNFTAVTESWAELRDFYEKRRINFDSLKIVRWRDDGLIRFQIRTAMIHSLPL